MRKQIFTALAALAVMLLVVSSCKKEPEPAQGDALFEYTTEGLTVHFTNKSTIEDPKSFVWDFGDGGTSNEENPTHTYAQKGEYTVTLTVIDQSDFTHSISTKLKVDKASPVKLDDGTLDDWNDVNTFVIQQTNGGAIKLVKFDYDVNYIYVYVEAETEDTVIHGIFFDTDLDSATGFNSHYWPVMGCDILAQAKPDEGQDWGVFSYSGDPATNSWGWDQIVDNDLQVLGAYQSENGVVKYEIGYDREKIPGLDGNSVEVGLYISNTAWAEIGYAPDSTSASITDGGYVINLNLAGEK